MSSVLLLLACSSKYLSLCYQVAFVDMQRIKWYMRCCQFSYSFFPQRVQSSPTLFCQHPSSIGRTQPHLMAFCLQAWWTMVDGRWLTKCWDRVLSVEWEWMWSFVALTCAGGRLNNYGFRIIWMNFDVVSSAKALASVFIEWNFLLLGCIRECVDLIQL